MPHEGEEGRGGKGGGVNFRGPQLFDALLPVVVVLWFVAFGLHVAAIVCWWLWRAAL